MDPHFLLEVSLRPSFFFLKGDQNSLEIESIIVQIILLQVQILKVELFLLLAAMAFRALQGAENGGEWLEIATYKFKDNLAILMI